MIVLVRVFTWTSQQPHGNLNVGVTDYTVSECTYTNLVSISMPLQRHALQHTRMPGRGHSLWGWDTIQTIDLAISLSAYLVLQTSCTHTCPSSTGQSFPI